MENQTAVLVSEVACKNCGLVNDYRVLESGPHKTAYCNGCDLYIKHLPTGKPMQFFFGKYKGRALSSLVAKEELDWLQWALRNIQTFKPHQKEEISKHLKHYNIGL